METTAQPEALARFKDAQKQGWAYFAPLEAFTTPAAARLVNHARITAGMCVLDVACGTGVVAITAALRGAQVTALDLRPRSWTGRGRTRRSPA